MELAYYLSKNLKTYRQFQGKSQVQFAKELGVAKSTLQEIERGKSPNLDTVSCIAEHLGVPACVLLSDAYPPTQLSILLHMLHSLAWFSTAPASQQEECIQLLLKASALFTSMKDAQVTAHDL